MNRQLIIALLCVLSFSANADRNFYGVLSAGYAQNEIDNYELDKASYKVSIGYELSPQWYVEAGYQALGEENASAAMALTDADIAEFSALYLSVLGKARGQYGELFYKLGAARVDTNVESVSNLVCTPGPVCQVDESLIAGVIGLGFDLYVHHSTMLRFEVEHMQGEQDYSANAAYIGVRLNF
jgi:hypothetical protein